MIRIFILFFLLVGTLTASAQTVSDCTRETAIPIQDGFPAIEADQPYEIGVNNTYCFDTYLPLNLPDGLGTVKLISDIPGGYPFTLFVTDLETGIVVTLSEFEDSLLINEGQLYFVEIMPTSVGTGHISLTPVELLVALGGEPDTIEVEIIGSICPTPIESFTCGNQSYSQTQDNASEFAFSTDDDAHPVGGNWRINGLSYENYSTASLDPTEGILRYEIPEDGTYDICYEILDVDGCPNYCCQTYCLDVALTNDEVNFTLAPGGRGYNISFDLPGATDVSYYGGLPFVDEPGTSFLVPFFEGGCYSTVYTFRYREGDCWKTARFPVYICNPYVCESIVYDFDRQDETWDLSLMAGSASSVTWIDDTNGGATLSNVGATLSIDPRPEEQCGLRNISARYFDGVSWRYCGTRFWDCNPYSCTNFTARTDEAGEALELTFTGTNAAQITWSDDATGQNIPDSEGETVVSLDWPEAIGCQMRFISVRYFDVALEIFRFCAIEVEVCRPEPCEEPTESFSCGNQQFFQNSTSGGSNFTFNTTDSAYPDQGNWRINGGDFSGVSYANLLPDGTLECDFPSEGSYDICYITVDNEGCENYCCRTYCIDFTPPVEPTTFEVAADRQGYDLTLRLNGASDVSWYVLGQPGLEGDGANIRIPFPVQDCFYQTYHFRYFEGGCWKVAIRNVFVCDPFNCNDAVYNFDRQDETWSLSFTAANASSVTWLDDDNGGTTLVSGTTALSIAPRSEGQCGLRNISVRYFDGTGWRFCNFQFWDCNPYNCDNLTTQTDEAEEALNLIFTGLNLTQVTWSDDATGQSLPNSDGQTAVSLDWPVLIGCQTRFISLRYFDVVLGVFRFCAIEVEVCRPNPCVEPTESFSCGNQQFFQNGINGGSNFTFNTTDSAYPDQGNWRINGGDFSGVSYANLLPDGTLECDFPTEGSYDICYITVDNEGCENYCCRTYCIDFTPPVEPTTFEVAADELGYDLTLNLTGVSDVSWYVPGQPTLEGNGPSVNILFPAGGCFYETYYFRYFEGGCWKTATRRVFVCNPFNCNEVAYVFDRQGEAWDLSLPAANANSVTWLDDDNGGATLASGTTTLSIDSRPEGQCGPRKVSVRYFDGQGWRYCYFSFWDCDPYDCTSFTTQTNETAEVLLLVFTGNNATQTIWRDDETGQNLPNSAEQTIVPLAWPVTDCQTRFISVQYFDTALNVFRACGIEVDVCRPVQCTGNDFVDDCNELSYFRSGLGDYEFLSTGEVAENENWLINRVPSSEVGYPALISENTLSCVFPQAGTYEICYPFLDEDGCVDYCCEAYCIDVVSNEGLIDFNYDGSTERYRLRLEVEEAEQVSWYYLDDAGIPQPSLGNTAFISAPAAGDCFTRTYYFSYLDASACPRVAFRRVSICNPLTCDNIIYRYDRVNNEYDLTFIGIASGGSIQWLDDDAGGTAFDSTTEQLSIPLSSGGCGPRNVNIRYFDGASWRICGLRYWACNPYQCNDLTAADDESNEQYIFSFTGSNSATEISWQDDVSENEIDGSSGQREVVLAYPVEGCNTRYLSVRYFDPSFGGYRDCAIEQEICRPQVCSEPTFSESCSDQNYFQLQNGDYRFITTNTVAEGEPWLVNGTPEGQGVDSLTISLTEVGSYTVCYPFLDGNGCFNYCCQTYCIETEPEPKIVYQYENNGNTLRLELTEQDATSIDWYLYNNGLRVSLGNGQVITRTVLPTCGFVTYYVRYFSDECWKVGTRTVWVCNPLNCSDISYAYNQTDNGFDLELTSGGTVSSISWQDDDTGITLTGDGQNLFLPVEGECRYRNIRARYFDGTGWRDCALRLYLCDPYACGDVSYDFGPDSDVITFELIGANNATDISWTDDDSGQSLPGSSERIMLTWDGDCRVQNISVRYRNSVTGGWHICGFRFFACAPESCEASILFERRGNDEVIISTNEGFTQLSWTVDGANAGSENVLSTVILAGESRTVCVRYFDPANGYFRTCCRTITIPNCELPVPAFSIERIMDTVTVVNGSPDAEVTYLWEFGETAQSTLPQPPSLHLPAGLQIICLTVTNACGDQRICQEVVIPDPENDLALELGDSECAAPGEMVSVPLYVRNFRDINSFQFSLSLPTPRHGILRNIRFQNEDGVETYFVLNDSTLAVSWIRTDTMSATIADSTVIALVDIEMTGSEDATGAVIFSDFPNVRNYEYINGQPPGVPGTVDSDYQLCLPTGSITGRIRREDGAGIGQVIVLLEEDGLNIRSMTTDATGNYSFTGLQPGKSYKVVLLKDINYRNGVTAGDLSRIQQHISQSPELATPYKRIAADVSNLGEITAGDIAEIRQLIFREINTFEGVNSWEFVPLDYNFPDPDSPHDPSFPNFLDFTASSVELSEQDFMGMKMGDIGDSADPESINASATGWVAGAPSDLSFALSSEAPMRNQSYRVDVRASDFVDLVAAQFSLGWRNGPLLRFDSLSNLNEVLEMSEDNFSTARAGSGRLAWLWFSTLPVSLADSSILFSVYFTITGEVGQELAISFTEDPTEFSFENTDTVLIGNFTDLQKAIVLPTSNRSLVTVKEWRVFPNPTTNWINVMTIGGGSGPEQLELFDSRGRSVRNWKSTVEGTYSIAGLPTGVYQLMLSSAVGVQVSRLVVID